MKENKENVENKMIPVFFPTGTFMNPFEEGIGFDPLASYIGVMRDAMEQPVQDADDL